MPHEEQSRHCPTLLDQALHLNPDYALAHALAGWCHEWRFTRSGFQESERSRAFQHARAAATGDDPTAAAIAGFSMVFLTQDRGEPLEALGRAVALNPCSATATYLPRRSCAFDRGPARGGSDFRRSGSPTQPQRSPRFRSAHGSWGRSDSTKAATEDAAECFARAARANPKFSTAYFFRGMAQARAGHADRAGPCLRLGRELEPHFRTRMLFEIGMAPALAHELAEGGRLLGLSE